MKASRQIIIFIIMLAALGVVLSRMDLPGTTREPAVPIGTLVADLKAGKVARVEVEDSRLNIIYKDGKTVRATKESDDSLVTVLKNYGVTAEELAATPIEVKEPTGLAVFFGTVLPYLLPFLFIAAFIFLMMRQAQGMNSRAMSFGQSSARELGKDRKDKVTFKDVAGVREAKEELTEIVEFLKNPKKFIALGAKIPKGVLLMGSPGTGKTLLARAVAGEADVPFFHISGSEFVEMFVGVGAARVRDLFAKAKKGAPCIVFIDEIDAVGRQRGAGLGGSHDEREQTLNQILVEMDGFDPNAGVIVVAATNRPDVLDPALLRPGRFDRRVVLDPPDIRDREEILGIHAKGKPLAADVNLKRIAERTPGFSGADLANLFNEAAILAARRNLKQVTMNELIPAIEKVLLGPERKSHVLSEEEREVTAYHEGGHALVAHELPHADPVQKVSVISRGQAAGYTLKMPAKDRHLRSRAEFLDDLAVSLGGFVAEREVFGRDAQTTGASSDLQAATRTAKRLITSYGMSDKLGPRTFGEREEMIFLGREIHGERDYSEKTAETIDEEVSRLVNEALKRAEHIIRSQRAKLDEIAKVLIEKETIEQEEFEALFTTHPHLRQAPKKPEVTVQRPAATPSARKRVALEPKPANL